MTTIKNKDQDQTIHAQTDFLARMNHELRTPMNAMLGLTHLLKRTNLDPVQQSYIEKLEKNTNELHTIISDILDINRLQAGKTHIEQVTFSMVDLFNNLLEHHSGQAREKNLNLYFEIDDEMEPYVSGDAEKIKQVLSNLISNAIKFTHEGSVRVRCEVLEDLESQQKLVFKVIDSGIGISKETLAEIFKPFVQEDKGLQKKYYGTGLGLTICKHYVEAMGGKISARSEVNVGTDFYFVLNLEKSALSNKEIITFNKHQNNSMMYMEEYFKNTDHVRSNNLCCKEIVVADDDPVNLEISSAFMKNWGVFVHKASDGQEVIDILKENNIDLIIMDLKMPNKDGYQTAKEIRESFNKEQLPIILLSGSNFLEEYDYLDQDVFNDYLLKPIDPGNLYVKINETFGNNNKQTINKNDSIGKNIEYSLEHTPLKRELFGLLTVVEKRNPLKIKAYFNDLTKKHPDFSKTKEFCYFKTNLDNYNYEQIISSLRKVIKE